MPAGGCALTTYSRYITPDERLLHSSTCELDRRAQAKRVQERGRTVHDGDGPRDTVPRSNARTDEQNPGRDSIGAYVGLSWSL